MVTFFLRKTLFLGDNIIPRRQGTTLFLGERTQEATLFLGGQSQGTLFLGGNTQGLRGNISREGTFGVQILFLKGHSREEHFS